MSEIHEKVLVHIRRGARSAVTRILVVSVLFALPLALQGRQKRGKSLSISGVTSQVQPALVTVVAPDGKMVTVVCKEDFTSKVAVGSKVTAWYTPKDGLNELDWLEYPLENFFESADKIRSQVKKVLMVPSYGVPNSEGLVERIGRYLAANLDWYVTPPMLGEELRQRTSKMTSTLDTIDPATGQVDMKRYVDAQQGLIASEAAESRTDAVLEVSVEQVQAKFADHVAQWDGVSQPVANRVTRMFSNMTPLPVNGDVPAASVDLKLWDAHGKLLWVNRRGFAVLALRTGVGFNFRERPLTEVYQDEASLHDWLVAALGTLAPDRQAPPASVAAARQKGTQ